VVVVQKGQMMWNINNIEQLEEEKFDKLFCRRKWLMKMFTRMYNIVMCYNMRLEGVHKSYFKV
jgi:hypothetical protein